MATLTVGVMDRDGLQLSAVAAAGGGDEFANTGKEFVYIKNADVSSMTLTIVTDKTIDGEAVADKTVSVGASEEFLVGPFPTDIYNDTNDRVQLTYSSVVSLTVAAVQLTTTK